MKAITATFLCVGAIAASLNAEVLVRVSPEKKVFRVAPVVDEVWVATEDGAYCVDCGVHDRLLAGTTVNTVAEVEGRVWLGTEKGLFIVEGSQAKRILGDKIGYPPVNVIHAFESSVLLGTNFDLFRIDGGTVSVILEGEFIRTVAVTRDAVWAGTSTNAYRIDGAGFPSRVFDDPTKVMQIVEAGNHVWVVTNLGGQLGKFGPCYRLDDGRPRKLFAGYEVISIAEVAGEPWFATTRGVFRLVKGRPQQVHVDGLKKGESVNKIAVVQSHIWIGTIERAYHRRMVGSDEAFVAVPNQARSMNVKGIVAAAGRVWVWGRDGIYRFDENVKIEFRLPVFSLMSANILFGRTLRIEEARYVRQGEDVSDERYRGDFEAVVQIDQTKRGQGGGAGDFTPVNDYKVDLSYWFHDLHIVVRDTFGNSTSPESQTILVVPGGSFYLVVSVILLPICVLVILRWQRKRIEDNSIWRPAEDSGTGTSIADTAGVVQADDMATRVRADGTPYSGSVEDTVGAARADDTATGQPAEHAEIDGPADDAKISGVADDTAIKSLPDRPDFRAWVAGGQFTANDGKLFANIAIVFTDVIGSTRLVVKLRDDRWTRVFNSHIDRANELIKEHIGYLIKETGDGIMAAFRSAYDAVIFALKLERCTGHELIKIRAGVHVGQVQIRSSDAHGRHVNMAKRISSMAESGGVWVSDRVKDDIEGSVGEFSLHWTKQPNCSLKGFEGTFTLWSVEYRKEDNDIDKGPNVPEPS